MLFDRGQKQFRRIDARLELNDFFAMEPFLQRDENDPAKVKKLFAWSLYGNVHELDFATNTWKVLWKLNK